jgi:asparagine synthase (glutamine-hydrolysing)
VHAAVLGPALADTGWIDPGYLRHVVHAHQSGSRDYSAPLWSLLMFEAFLRNSMGSVAGSDHGSAEALRTVA